MNPLKPFERAEIERIVTELKCPDHPNDSIKVIYLANDIAFGGACACTEFQSLLREKTEHILTQAKDRSRDRLVKKLPR